ncbi:hypothetical protein BZU93_23635 [Salmonella enterica subsp. enterica]|nr:hypothetical protein [Salmonella enterica subsp. enterica serovar Enteritidis]
MTALRLNRRRPRKPNFAPQATTTKPPYQGWRIFKTLLRRNIDCARLRRYEHGQKSAAASEPHLRPMDAADIRPRKTASCSRAQQ